MLSRLLCVFLFALSALCAESNAVLRKTCHDVLPGCRIHSASVDPCTGNPRQCRIKRREDHRLHVDFTPHFDADNLTLAMEHVRQNQTRTEIDACRFATCPMAARERQSLDLKFNFDINIPSSKYNLKVKIFDPRDESKACCYTFKVSYVNP